MIGACRGRGIALAIALCCAAATRARADEPTTEEAPLATDANPATEAPAPVAVTEPVAEGDDIVRLPGYIDANAYHDTRGFSTLTINLFAVLPRGFSYFGFADFTTTPGSHVGDTTEFFTEHNVQWGRWATFPVELHLQWQLSASVAFNPPDRVRVGARFHAAPTRAVGRFFDRIHLTAMVTYFPYVQTLRLERPGTWESQISFFYRLEPFADRIDRRIYFQGWGDFDFRTGEGYADLMTEHQVGVRLVSELYVVAELRFATFFPERFGAGFGLEYRVLFEVPTRTP